MTERPKRRLFRFSLRTFLVLFTAFAIWLGWNVHQVQRRKAVTNYIGSFGAGARITYGEPVRPWKRLPVMWRLMGVRSVRSIELTGYELCDELTDDDRQQFIASFPEAWIAFPKCH